ncbi:hypothetical protein DN387_04905 [Pseudomonas sp. FBF18]|nr:hypothetical protein [Pseudomonas sp. FBF18]
MGVALVVGLQGGVPFRWNAGAHRFATDMKNSGIAVGAGLPAKGATRFTRSARHPGPAYRCLRSGCCPHARGFRTGCIRLPG